MDVIICPLSQHAKLTPEALALISPEKSWNYRALDGAVNALALHLQDQGISEGARVAFIGRSTPATLILFFALFRLGAIACPLSYRIPDAQIAAHLKQLAATHFLNEPPLLAPLTPSEPAQIPLNHIATLLFTSGSSGAPKVAAHSFNNHYSNARAAAEPLHLSTDSRWLLSLPLFHVGGIAILFRCLCKGATIVLSSSALGPSLAEYEITHLSLVPTQLYRLLKDPPRHQLRCVLVGGAPIAPALLQEALDLSLPLFLTYGMTEMSSITTLARANALKIHAGKNHAASEWKLASDGEIHVKGKALFQGYWDAEKEEISRPDCAGWFPTKDLGSVSEEGDLQWMGRKDRQFISGGENIQPEEIEQALLEIVSIRNATVLPQSDPEFGMRPIAFIEDASQTHSLEGLRTLLKNRLPSFKHPIALYAYPPELLQQGIKLTPALLIEHLRNQSVL